MILVAKHCNKSGSWRTYHPGLLLRIKPDTSLFNIEVFPVGGAPIVTAYRKGIIAVVSDVRCAKAMVDCATKRRTTDRAVHERVNCIQISTEICD